MGHSRTVMTQEEWGQLQATLERTVGKNNYLNWIKPLSFAGVSDGVATFHVPTNFMGTYVSDNFGDLLLHQIAAADSPIRELADIDPQNQGQPNVSPPQKGRITVGTEFVPYENEETHERYAIDLRFQFGYATEGRDYSPMYDHCPGSSGSPYSAIQLAPASSLW